MSIYRREANNGFVDPKGLWIFFFCPVCQRGKSNALIRYMIILVFVFFNSGICLVSAVNVLLLTQPLLEMLLQKLFFQLIFLDKSVLFVPLVWF